MKRETRRDASGEEHTTTEQDRQAAAARLLRRAEPEADRFHNMTVAQVVAACARVYAQEVARLHERGDLDGAEIKNKAAELWRGTLPDLVDYRTIMAYIGCIAWGTKMKLLSPADIKGMIFMAQTQLTVLRSMTQQQPAQSRPPEAKPGEVGELFMQADLRPQSSMEPEP